MRLIFTIKIRIVEFTKKKKMRHLPHAYDKYKIIKFSKEGLDEYFITMIKIKITIIYKKDWCMCFILLTNNRIIKTFENEGGMCFTSLCKL